MLARCFEAPLKPSCILQFTCIVIYIHWVKEPLTLHGGSGVFLQDLDLQETENKQ